MRACPADWMHVSGRLRPHAVRSWSVLITYLACISSSMSPVYYQVPRCSISMCLGAILAAMALSCVGKHVDTWMSYIMSAWPQICCQSALCCFCRYVKCSNALHIERDLTELQAEVDAFELHR